MISIIFSANQEHNVTKVKVKSPIAIARNAGGLIALLYVLGLLLTHNASRSRQEFSLVQRTYKTRLLTDKELN